MLELVTDHLGRAQDQISQAAERVSEVVNKLAAQHVGTQRLDFLAQALAQLNCAYALVRASMNDSPTAGCAVRMHLPVGIKQMPPETPNIDMKVKRQYLRGGFIVEGTESRLAELEAQILPNLACKRTISKKRRNSSRRSA